MADDKKTTDDTASDQPEGITYEGGQGMDPTQFAPASTADAVLTSNFTGPQDANEFFATLEDKDREPIPYTGPQDPADFAPPGVDLRDPASRGVSPYTEEQQAAEDERERALAKIQAERQSKVVAAPEQNKPTTRSRATGKGR